MDFVEEELSPTSFKTKHHVQRCRCDDTFCNASYKRSLYNCSTGTLWRYVGQQIWTRKEHILLSTSYLVLLSWPRFWHQQLKSKGHSSSKVVWNHALAMLEMYIIGFLEEIRTWVHMLLQYKSSWRSLQCLCMENSGQNWLTTCNTCFNGFQRCTAPWKSRVKDSTLGARTRKALG